MRAPAKRYFREIGWLTPGSEALCVETLIAEHRRTTASTQYRRLSWFGRLLWSLFGRWL